jgi:Pycsar effector protein
VTQHQHKPAGDEAVAERIRVMHAEGREELVRADGKASILLAAAMIVLGALLAAVVAGDWSPSQMSSTFWEMICWAGILAGLAGVAALGAAVFPRVKHSENKDSVRFFGDAARMRSAEDLHRSVKQDVAAGVDRTADQLLQISKIVTKKYRLIQAALVLFAIGALLSLGAVAIDHATMDSTSHPKPAPART